MNIIFIKLSYTISEKNYKPKIQTFEVLGFENSKT